MKTLGGLALISATICAVPTAAQAGVEVGGPDNDVTTPVFTPGGPLGSAPEQPGYCDANTAYPNHVWEQTGGVRDDPDGMVGIRFDTGEIHDVVDVVKMVFGGPVPEPVNLEVKEVYTNIWCEDDEGVVDPASDISQWVLVPEPQAVVPDLLRWLYANLHEPTVTFPDRNPDHGWLYANVPMDFRLAPMTPNPIREQLTVRNILGSATGWIRAEPTNVVFDSGEPDSRPVTCTYEQALAPYDVEEPGVCSYTYSWSSGIDDSGAFPLTVSVVWDITSSAPATINRSITTYSEDIVVSEIQAIETTGR